MGVGIPFIKREPAIQTRVVRINDEDVMLVNEADAGRLLGIPADDVLNTIQPRLLIVVEAYYAVDDVRALKENKDTARSSATRLVTGHLSP